MKNTFKIIGIIALAAIIGIVALSCDEGAPTPPTVTTASLPGGMVGTAYTATLAATGDTPITWSIDSGSLPAGLTLAAATGVISGTPTAAGTATFTVKATNDAGDGTRALSIVISPAPPTIDVIQTITVDSAPIGFETDTITLINEGQPNYWIRGTATARSGSNSLYITNNGTTNAYVTNNSSVVHAYVDAEIPATGAFLRFSWRAMGESASTAYDYLRVYVAPISTVPVAGVLEPTGATVLGTHRSGSATIWGEQVIAIPAGNNNSTVRIIFTWRNDSNSGTQPPAAIDNIELIEDVAGDGTHTATKLTVGASPVGFEEGNPLVLVNGLQPSYWVRGTATARVGSNSLYITNNGTVNAYTTSMSSVVHAYIDADIPSDGASLRFSWKAQGESSSTAYDYLRVYVAPVTTVPIAGVLNPTGSAILGTYRVGSATIWGEQVIAIPAGNNNSTVRIIFTWINDSNSGTQPPAAIDNISLEGSVVGSDTTATKLTVDGSPVDFESGNPLVLVNGLQPNYWMRGTAAAQAGTNSLYITNDGTANAYSTTMSSVVHAYIDAEIPSGGASLRYNWRVQGESSAAAYDYLQVRVVPTTTVPVAGVSTLTGSANLGSHRNGGATTWGQNVAAIPVGNNGTTVRIVFTWINDSSSGSQPPAAIDNIELIVVP